MSEDDIVSRKLHRNLFFKFMNIFLLKRTHCKNRIIIVVATTFFACLFDFIGCAYKSPCTA